MRIVLSNASFKWGGVHQVTDQLATGLQSRGHQIAIFCRPGSVLEQRLSSRFDCQPIAQGMDFSPIAVGRIRRALRSWAPDVVVTLMDKDLRLTGAAARTLGIPIVARRANDRALHRSPYHLIVYRTIPTVHVANSQATRRTMIESTGWLPPDRIRVIYNGIDPMVADAAPRARLPVPANACVVGFIGRLEVRKGIRDLLEAWPKVTAQSTDVHLVIVGRGPLEDEVQARVKTLERAHYLGYRDDIPGIMNAVDIIAMPSHWEGFGLVAAEAMAACKPVIAANASSLPELIRDGQDGLLVEPRDPEALARDILMLVWDPDFRKKLGTSARARVESEFSLARMIDGYEALLLEIAEKR